MLTRWFFFMALVGFCFLLLACDGHSSESPGDGDIPDGDVMDGDLTDGDTSDGDIGDGDEDGDLDDEEESGPLEIPFVPQPLDEPLIDAPYDQEFNHTTNEADASIGALVALVTPPEAYTDFDVPTLVTPRGVVLHRTRRSQAELVRIPEDDPDVKWAAASPNVLVLASDTRLYTVHPDGSLTSHDPGDDAIRGLADGVSGVLVLLSTGLHVMEPGQPPVFSVPCEEASAALETDQDLFVACQETDPPRQVLFRLPKEGEGNPEEILSSLPASASEPGCLTTGTIRALLPDVTLPDSLDLVLIGDDGLQGLDLSSPLPDTPCQGRVAGVSAFSSNRVPLAGPRAAAVMPDGGFVVATSGGGYRIMDRGDGPEWRVYNAERWLPDADARDVWVDATKGSVWFATAGGLGGATTRRMTVEDKMAIYAERLRERHDRDGAVADSHLMVRGDLSTNIPYDSDNDGGWTCYQVMGQCFKYLVTGDPEAKAAFDASLQAMLNLRLFTGTEHFLARSLIRKEGCRLDDCDDPDDGEWFTSPDGKWWVKADTSNDEVTSHMFMMGYAYDLCADEAQKAGIVAHVDGIVGGLVDNGYQLLDLDGLVTSFGQFDPGYVNVNFEGKYGDGGRRSAQMLAALTLAHYLTHDPRYLEAKWSLINEHDYADNAVRESEYPFRRGSGDGDELGMQAFHVLLRYEDDPRLRPLWAEGWRRSYGNIRLQQAAWWDFTNVVLGGEPALDYAMRWLRLVPVDLIRWTVRNSHRLDLALPPAFYHQDGTMRSDGFILPPDERRCDRYNTDQFRVDGGMDGWVEMDGAEIFSTYWMGRYFGLIVPQEI